MFHKIDKSWSRQEHQQPAIQQTEISPDEEQEIEDELYFCIHSGFYSKDTIYSQAHQMFEDFCMDNNVILPSEMYITQMIERLISDDNLIKKSNDNYVRLRNVFDILNRERIIAVHFAGYTLDDGFEEVRDVFQFMKRNEIPRRGYCFYHQQDIERAMDESMQFLMLAFHSMNGDKQIAMEVGERINELLIENGFDVEWDHSIDSRIKIKNFLWDKKYDGEDYGTDRAIRIMSETKSEFDV